MSVMFVVMVGDTPLEAAETLEIAQACAATRATRYNPDKELRWDEQKWPPRRGHRLMSRSDGSRRWIWSGFAVHAVPLAAAPVTEDGAR